MGRVPGERSTDGNSSHPLGKAAGGILKAQRIMRATQSPGAPDCAAPSGRARNSTRWPSPDAAANCLDGSQAKFPRRAPRKGVDETSTTRGDCPGASKGSKQWPPAHSAVRGRYSLKGILSQKSGRDAALCGHACGGPGQPLGRSYNRRARHTYPASSPLRSSPSSSGS